MNEETQLEERHKKHILITALAFAIVLFCAGLFLGFSVDKLRESEISNNIVRSELDAQSYFLEQQYLESFTNANCELFAKQVEILRNRNYETGRQLENWANAKYTFNKKDFGDVKRRYFIQEGQLLLLVENLRQNCATDYNSILFFYKIGDGDSVKQGYVLDSISLSRNDTLVLSFDKDFIEEPFVDLLLSTYGVEKTPTIIVNGKRKFEGLTSRAQIEAIL